MVLAMALRHSSMIISETAQVRSGPSHAAAVQAQKPQPENKQKRRSAPKVKTGCRECKASHVRCDEKQPTCGRCQRREKGCVYSVVQSKKRGNELSTEAAGFNRQYRILLPAHHAARPTRLVEPSATFLNPREVQYFDTFRHSVIYQLGYGSNEFWRRTVLRESSRDDCIRSAVVAVGALFRAQEEYDQIAKKERVRGKPQLPLCKASVTSSSSHYYNALSYYTKAVGSFRRLIAIASQQKNDPGLRQDGSGSGVARAVLIATMLLVVFESLQGNTATADQLSGHTLALLQNRIMKGSLSGERNKNSDCLPVSQIAGAIDDEGTCDTEVMLVRNTFFHSGLPSYAKGREVIANLARTQPRIPCPPDAAASTAVFKQLWTRCLILSSLRYVRIVHMAWAMQLSKGVASATSDPWAALREEQTAITEIIEAWQTATDSRTTIAESRARALAASSRAAADQTELATANRELNTYREIAIAVRGVYLSACTAFDLSGKAWDNYEAEIEDVVERIEIMLSEDKAASPDHDPATSPPRLAAAEKSSTVSGCYRLRHYYGSFEGQRVVLGHIAQHTRNPVLRRRLMTLWGSQVNSSSHWDLHGNYLGALAVWKLEEEQRDVVTGELPLEKQYHWVSGKWSEDYAEFEVTLMAKMPDKNGLPPIKLVAMPAMKP